MGRSQSYLGPRWTQTNASGTVGEARVCRVQRCAVRSIRTTLNFDPSETDGLAVNWRSTRRWPYQTVGSPFIEYGAGRWSISWSQLDHGWTQTTAGCTVGEASETDGPAANCHSTRRSPYRTVGSPFIEYGAGRWSLPWSHLDDGWTQTTAGATVGEASEIDRLAANGAPRGAGLTNPWAHR